jgi:hypothetical protein
MHIAVCGASTGRLNVYTIHSAALPQAQALGFRLLVTRQMSNEIKRPTPLRRGAALPRTLQSTREVVERPIPHIW